ncbi:hypothetical protein [Legionella bozemanae]|uniref:hypothetical protein n=1 Tax=Legionella bozemanae TaxID=447 RepID=UPI001041A15F|nr:hypothetical protein [Legionella bozemanae]
MQNKQEKPFENSRFLNNEKEIARLQSSNEYNPYQIIFLCQENLNFIQPLIANTKEEELPEILYDEALQLELLNKLGIYYLSLFKALSSIKNPTERDELDQVKYRKLAEEYNSEGVKQIDMELERVQLDEDYAMALYLKDLEENEASPIYPGQRFFKLKPEDDDSNIDLKQQDKEEDNPSKKESYPCSLFV